MKQQTLEEAAKENILFNHRTVDRTLSGGNLAQFGITNFIQGAEWQAKQSPWISVKDRLPEIGDPCLIRLKDGTVRLTVLDIDDNSDVYFWSDNYSYETISGWDVTHWCPIPSFDEILEANKDVLERIKEKEVSHG
ncbi:DUF551 domain-containing protein [Bacteroides thetaiotaomicron]|uniref:DUF551 domain-containing protein n=1 Tax=Bacteroides thetaiotaomicron TaxID=818 RepID=UPI002165726E|nr:DUF551 domain-containing protein [Bacteroides thetaiotaomicron]MCS2293110.1 DUF551 domain-containing protein [Bacteroides thetaiotaomicron]MCS2294615.1 DUF551 domain-containing protein [Bacteroides thetaiotaomicron]